jgi:hypothetical protein
MYQWIRQARESVAQASEIGVREMSANQQLDLFSEIERLRAKTKEIDVRASLLSNYLGAMRGVTDTWAGEEIWSDRRFFFDIALNALKDGLVINTCALLQKPKPNATDDAILQEYRDFIEVPGAVDALIVVHRGKDPQHSQFHDDLIRRAATELKAELDGIDRVHFEQFYRFRNKRIAHSTSTQLVVNPTWGDLFAYARLAIKCADLVYQLFQRSSFDHDGAEKMSFESGAKAILPHLEKNLKDEDNWRVRREQKQQAAQAKKELEQDAGNA